MGATAEYAYELAYGDEQHYDRAYTVHALGRVLVFVGEVTGRMTRERKAAMHAAMLDAYRPDWREALGEAAVGDLAAAWERHPYIRRDDVTVRECTVTRVADGVDTMRTWDYSDAHGGGSWHYDATTFLTWDEQAGTFV